MDEKPALRPDSTVGETLRGVARGTLAAARSALEHSDRPDADAVHDFRKEMKRWRALLWLLTPFLGPDGERLRIEARDLSRGLGGARNLQAALDAIDDLSRHGMDLPGRSIGSLRRRIEVLRQAEETIALTPERRASLAAALDDAWGAVAQWPLERMMVDDLAERLARGYRSARRKLPEDWDQAGAEVLHELRKRVISLRYHMEIVQPTWPRFGKMWIAETQRLRERLGRHQDLVTLEALAAPHQPLAHWRARLAPAIRDRKHRHVTAARRIAARLFVEKPGAFRRRLAVMWQTDR
jgi:CHAD domain-containing protein